MENSSTVNELIDMDILNSDVDSTTYPSILNNRSVKFIIIQFNSQLCRFYLRYMPHLSSNIFFRLLLTKMEFINRWRNSGKLLISIVAVASLLDCILLTVVIPIIPEFLYELNHPHTDNDNTTIWTKEEILAHEDERNDELSKENKEIGLMFSSKAFFQLVTNPFVGYLTHKIGYSIPMMFGFVILFVSTITFAFAQTYIILFIARSIQGVGSSFTTVSGLGMVAQRFRDNNERGKAMGVVLSAMALGILIGPPFGGVMYEYVGKTSPFLILAALALGDGLLRFIILQPKIQADVPNAPSLKALLSDPYILITAGSFTFVNNAMGVLEPSLPIWMIIEMNSSKLEQGLVFLPSYVAYLIGASFFGWLGHKIGRWRMALFGFIISGVSLLCTPLARTPYELMPPITGFGISFGMVDAAVMPELGHLVDIRHTGVYGSVYAIGDTAFCLGYITGPAISGVLVNLIGFKWMCVAMAAVSFAYAPLLLFLRSPPVRKRKSLDMGIDNPIWIMHTNDVEVTTKL